MTEELTTKEKESLLIRAASLIIKSKKKRKRVSIQIQIFLWGFIVGSLLVALAMVKP